MERFSLDIVLLPENSEYVVDNSIFDEGTVENPNGGDIR